MWALPGWTWPVSVCLLACAGQPQRQEHVVVPPRTAEISEGFPATAPPPLADAEDVCPMAVEGADVNLVPIKGGSALVFTTALASPIPLRQRVWHFAARYDADGSPGAGLSPPEAAPAGFPTSAQYSEVVAGARVEIRPLSDYQLRPLRAHLTDLVEHMRRTRTCR